MPRLLLPCLAVALLTACASEAPPPTRKELVALEREVESLTRRVTSLERRLGGQAPVDGKGGKAPAKGGKAGGKGGKAPAKGGKADGAGGAEAKPAIPAQGGGKKGKAARRKDGGEADTPGEVSSRGDARVVYLLRQRARTNLPAQVEPGTYTVMAAFGEGRATQVRTLDVPAGGEIVLHCTAASKGCEIK